VFDEVHAQLLRAEFDVRAVDAGGEAFIFPFPLSGWFRSAKILVPLRCCNYIYPVFIVMISNLPAEVKDF